MAQLEQHIQDEKHTIISLLKMDDKGWNVKLFEDRSKLSTCICVYCAAVCCDAVELGCDHNDDDIFLYCHHCLKQLITDNHNKCPIDGHVEPVIISNRASRRHVSKAMVFCPYSVAYKAANNEINNDNDGHIHDTMGGDEKEGNQNIAAYQQYEKHKGCTWKGTLNDLINNHLAQCAQKYNPSFTLNIKINKLENENKALNEEMKGLRTEINDKIMQNEQLKIRIGQQNKCISEQNLNINGMKLENEQFKKTLNLKIHTLENENKEKDATIISLKQENKELKSQLNGNNNNPDPFPFEMFGGLNVNPSNNNNNNQQQQQQQPNPLNMMFNPYMMGMGGMGGQQQQQQPEILYRDELTSLNACGFTDAQANINALIATGGDVLAAIDKLLQQ